MKVTAELIVILKIIAQKNCGEKCIETESWHVCKGHVLIFHRYR